MPLAAVKTQNNSGRTAGTNVATGHFDNFTDPSGNLKYVNVGDRIWVSTADIATGSNGVVIQHAQLDSKFAQLSFVFMVTALPSAAMEVCHVRTGTLGTSTKRTNWLLDSTGGNPRIALRSGGDVSVFSAVLALNVPYIARLRFDSGTTTTNGRTGGSVVRVSDLVSMGAGEKTDADNGAGALVALHQTGKVSSTGTVGLLMDDFAFWDSAYALIDPASAPPSMTVTSDGPFWMHDGRGVSGGAYTLAHVSGPNHLSEAQEPVEGLFFVPQDSSASTYTMTVTTGSGSDFETVVVPVASSGGPVPGSVRRRVWNGSALL